jgi:hypothetical protein
MDRREMLATLGASAALPAGRLVAFQGVQLGELRNPVDLNALREKFQAGDPINLKKLRDARWNPDRAAQYMEKFGVVKGVNYSTRFGLYFRTTMSASYRQYWDLPPAQDSVSASSLQ